VFGKLKKDERKELEELRKKEIMRLEEDILIIKKCINVMTKVAETNKNITEQYVEKLFQRIENLEDKEIDKKIDKEIEKLYQ
jgi:hypothetical protein